MGKKEELALFLERADEMINSKYILADIKIVNLLKSIAASETLIALFKNCLEDFDYAKAKKTYLVKSPYLSEDKGEFVMPESSIELLAFTFSILMDIDSKNIDLYTFLDKYFYVDGSSYSAYSAFLNSVIKPFRNTVKVIVENVIEGKIADPVKEISKKETQKSEPEVDKKAAPVDKTATFSAIKKIKGYLLVDKTKVKASKKKDAVKNELLTVVDTLANVIESGDKDAINYAFITYKYVAKAHPFLFLGRVRKIGGYLKDVTNEL